MFNDIFKNRQASPHTWKKPEAQRYKNFIMTERSLKMWPKSDPSYRTLVSVGIPLLLMIKNANILYIDFNVWVKYVAGKYQTVT